MIAHLVQMLPEVEKQKSVFYEEGMRLAAKSCDFYILLKLALNLRQEQSDVAEWALAAWPDNRAIWMAAIEFGS
jgi:hypothetical protein